MTHFSEMEKSQKEFRAIVLACSERQNFISLDDSVKTFSIANGACAHTSSFTLHAIFPPSSVILWIKLGEKPKWLPDPLNSAYHDVMHTVPITFLGEGDGGGGGRYLSSPAA